MNWIIPTYKRPHIILSHTLKLLERLEIPQKDIFIVVGCDDENDFNEYFYPINDLYPSINILVGDNSNCLASQLNFIRNELLEEIEQNEQNGIERAKRLEGILIKLIDNSKISEMKLTDLDGSVKLLLHYLAEEKAKNKEQLLKKIKEWC